MFEKLIQKFKELYDYEGEFIKLRSPGRVNLIGEHTDYNQGFVFPAAIALEIYGIALKRNDSRIRVYSMDFDEMQSFKINDSNEKTGISWANYIKGVLSEIKKGYGLLFGADVVFKSNLPSGSGLSSSAAFELINAVLFSFINDIKISKKELALLCQRAENSYVGVNCGIMDQFAIALGKKDSALFIDTRSLNYENVGLNLSGYKIVIGNTNKPRALADSAYNTRRKECETAANILKLQSLRDANIDMIEKNKNRLSDNVYKRAKHVVEENNRVIKSVDCFKKSNLKTFGKLMAESHNSLRDLYEVSCTELDILVDEALKSEGVIGSRMTGAGFGGCTVSIVKEGSIDKFKNIVGENYNKKTALKAEFYITEAVSGVEALG